MQNLSTNEIFTGNKKITGEAVRTKNLNAIIAVKNSIRSSFGCLGLDKMCIDSTGEVTITNDGATIIKLMDIEDPTAKILAQIAIQQDIEVGDGTTGVVLLAASLIEKGVKLINKGLHPSVVVSGYKIAYKEALRFIKKKLQLDSKMVNIEGIIDTAISSKVISNEKELFIKILLAAVQNIKTKNYDDKEIYKIENIKILKKQGKSMAESKFISGFTLNCIPPHTMIKQVLYPKIMCIDFGLSRVRLPLGVIVTISDPDKLEEVRKKEICLTLEKVKKIIETGATLILSTKTVDDSCIKAFNDAGVMFIKHVHMDDLEMIANGLGITVLSSLEEIEEDKNKLFLGEAEKVAVETVGDSECTFIYAPNKNISSLILRGPNEQVLEEMGRSVHDALCVIKRTLEHKKILPGGGAFECALSIYLEELSASLSSKEGAAIHSFSEALLDIPKILALNGGLNANELVANLLAIQQKGNREHKIDWYHKGLDVNKGTIENNITQGIVEPSQIKIKSLRSATEAAISVLRIDEIITIPEKKKEKRDQCY